MHEINDNSYPLGICQRFFNFVNNLFASTLHKRITLGQPLPQKPNGGVMVRYQEREKSKDNYDLGSEIPIRFKQSEGLESWTSVDKPGKQKEDPVHHADQGQLPTEPVPKDNKAIRKIEIPLVETNGTSKFEEKTERSQLRSKSSLVIEPKKTVSIKVSEEEEKIRKKGKNIASENLTLAMKDEDSNANITPRRFRPPLTVAPNINEKSDHFIRQKRASMNTNLGA